MANEVEDPNFENPNPKSPLPPPQSSPFSLSLNIWPPSQRTRDAVAGPYAAAAVEPLLPFPQHPAASSSVLARRYGALPHDEAAALAVEIEKDAFCSAADAAAGDEARAVSVDGGLEILEIYSKAISRKMLEVMKSRGARQTPTLTPTSPQPQPEAVVPIEGAEESVEAEAPAAA